MTKIYQRNYDSESITDISRDLSECLNPLYNDEAKILNDIDYSEVVYQVTFDFIDEDGKKRNLINKNYGNDSILDLEDNINDVFSSLDSKKDQHGFLEGEFILVISI